MSPLAQLLGYNVGASVVAALWVTGLVLLVVRLLGIRSVEVRNRLMSVALLKSTLVLLGLTTAMPLPAGFWHSVQAHGVPFETFGPPFLALTGILLVALPRVRSRAASRLVSSAVPVEEGERAASLTEALVERLNREPLEEYRCYGYRFEGGLPRPSVFRSEAVAAVAVVEGEPPSIVLPAPLERELDDEELEAVLAHELAHLGVRRSVGCCDPTWLGPLTWLNPSAWILARAFGDDEEVACDEIAARVTQKPEALASALLKSYRFENGASPPHPGAALLGKKGMLRRRVSRLVDGMPALGVPSSLRVSLAWALVVALAFVTL